MAGKRPDFANNWQKYFETPSEDFFDHTYIELMQWKVGGWELPSNVFCIIRATDLQTKKVKEHVYRARHAADNRLMAYCRDGKHEIVVCTDQAIHYVHPSDIDDTSSI